MTEPRESPQCESVTHPILEDQAISGNPWLIALDESATIVTCKLCAMVWHDRHPEMEIIPA